LNVKVKNLDNYIVLGSLVAWQMSFLPFKIIRIIIIVVEKAKSSKFKECYWQQRL